MGINLSENQEKFLSRMVKEGHFKNENDVIQEAFRLLKQRRNVKNPEDHRPQIKGNVPHSRIQRIDYLHPVSENAGL